MQSTEVRFASFLSGGFTAIGVMNLPEKKLEKRTSVHIMGSSLLNLDYSLIFIENIPILKWLLLPLLLKVPPCRKWATV